MPLKSSFFSLVSAPAPCWQQVWALTRCWGTATAQAGRRESARCPLGGIFTRARRIKRSKVQWETALTPESALC